MLMPYASLIVGSLRAALTCSDVHSGFGGPLQGLAGGTGIMLGSTVRHGLFSSVRSRLTRLAGRPLEHHTYAFAPWFSWRITPSSPLSRVVRFRDSGDAWLALSGRRRGRKAVGCLGALGDTVMNHVDLASVLERWEEIDLGRCFFSLATYDLTPRSQQLLPLSFSSLPAVS